MAAVDPVFRRRRSRHQCDRLRRRRRHTDRLGRRRRRRWLPGRNRRRSPRPRFPGALSVCRGTADHRGHERAVRVAVGQAVTAGHHVVAAGNQVRQSRVRGHAGVDDGDPHPGAAPEAPRLGQVEHVHVFRLHPKVAARQHPNLSAVGSSASWVAGPGRAVRRHRGRVDARRVDRVRRRPGKRYRGDDQRRGSHCGRAKRPQSTTTGNESLHRHSSTTKPAGRSASGRGIRPIPRACGTAGCRWC